MKTTSLFIYLCLAASSLFAQSWESTMEASMKYYEKSSYDTALHYAVRAKSIAEQTEGENSANYATALNNIALIQSQLNNYDEAELLYEQSKELRKNLLGENNAAYASTLTNLAALYKKKGEFNKAEVLYHQALGIRENTIGKNSMEYVQVQNNLADLYFKMGRYQEAEMMLQDVTVGKLKILGENNPEYVSALSNQGILYMLRGEYDKAESRLRAVATTRKSLLGAQHPEYASSLVNLARLHMRQGRYRDAQPLFTEVLQIWSQVAGEQNKQYAIATTNLAELERMIGNLSKAEQLQNKAIATLKKVAGEKDEDYAFSIGGLALIQASMDDYQKAENLFKQSLVLQQKNKANPLYIAVTINNFADMHFNNGNYSKAEPLYKQASEAYNSLSGKNSPDYINAQRSIAALYYRTGRYDEAGQLYEEIAPICRETFGAESPQYVDLLSSQAANYERAGKFNEAESLYRQALPLIQQVLGREHPDYIESLTRLGELYTRTGDYVMAENYINEALPLMRRVLGEKNPAYAPNLANLAELYYKMGNLGRAEVAFREAFDHYFTQVHLSYLYADDREKSELCRQINQLMSNFTQFAIERQATNPAIAADLFSYQLATKGLAFLNFNRVINSMSDTATVNRFNKWIEQRTHIAQLYRMPQVELMNRKVSVAVLEDNADRVQKDLLIRMPLLGSVANKRIYQWHHIQSRLLDGEAAVEIIRLQQQDEGTSSTNIVIYIALIVTKNTGDYPKMVILGNGSELEGSYLKDYYANINGEVQDAISYRRFWQPIGEVMGKVNKIYISPSGVYSQLNIAGLQNPASGKYVIEESNVQLVSCLKDLAVKPYATGLLVSKSSPAVFVAPSYQSGKHASSGSSNNIVLPEKLAQLNLQKMANINVNQTKQEAAVLQKILSPNKMKCQVYSGSAASETAVKKLQSPRVLHIATTGFYLADGVTTNNTLQDAFMRSGLFMAGAATGKSSSAKIPDGLLTAGEISQLNLAGTELVSLSVVGLSGETAGSTSLYDLQKAFLSAGADAILMNLSASNQAYTQEFLSAFYTNWMKSKNKVQAYQKTLVDFKERYGTPYARGNFVLVGE